MPTGEVSGLAHGLNWLIRGRFLPVTHFVRFGRQVCWQVFGGKNPAFIKSGLGIKLQGKKSAKSALVKKKNVNLISYIATQTRPHHVMHTENVGEITWQLQKSDYFTRIGSFEWFYSKNRFKQLIQWLFDFIPQLRHQVVTDVLAWNI